MSRSIEPIIFIFSSDSLVCSLCLKYWQNVTFGIYLEAQSLNVATSTSSIHTFIVTLCKCTKRLPNSFIYVLFQTRLVTPATTHTVPLITVRLHFKRQGSAFEFRELSERDFLCLCSVSESYKRDHVSHVITLTDRLVLLNT